MHMEHRKEWPIWKIALWLYSLGYTIILALIFVIVALNGGQSSNANQSSSGTTAAAWVLSVMFIPVIVFLIIARTDKY